MLRPACVWSLVLALAWGCAGSGDAEPRDPNQPAGKVIELAGQVSAAREGAASRPLAVGQVVFADDTVTTGADGSAVILLAHNSVRWSLGSDKSLRVDRSLAWKAKADQGGSAFDDEDPMATASAGRHTDREAGDTAATAQLPPAAPAEGAPPPADTVARAESKPAPPARSPRKERPRSAPAEVDATSDLLARESGGGGRALEIGGAAAAAPGAAPAPVASGNLVPGAVRVKGALSAAQVSGGLAQLGAGCRGSVPGKVVLHLEIDGSGKVVKVRLSGSPKAVSPISACVTKAARALSFPAAPGGGTTTVERDIEIAPAR